MPKNWKTIVLVIIAVVLVALTVALIVGRIHDAVALISTGAAGAAIEAARRQRAEDMERTREAVRETEHAIREIEEIQERADRDREKAAEDLANMSPEDKARLGDDLFS